jgi:hypothetical protein
VRLQSTSTLHDRPAAAHPRLPVPSSRFDAVGRRRPPPRRHRDLDFAQGGNDVDPAHRQPPRLPNDGASEHAPLGVALAGLALRHSQGRDATGRGGRSAPALPEDSSPAGRSALLGEHEVHLRRAGLARRLHVGLEPLQRLHPVRSRATEIPARMHPPSHSSSLPRTSATSGAYGSRGRRIRGRATDSPTGRTITTRAHIGTSGICRISCSLTTTI